MEKIAIHIESGKIKSPVWAEGPGAKNWAAIIRPELHFGLAREWLKRDNAHACYSTNKLSVGLAIEFGAELITDGPRGGKNTRRTTNRWYGVIAEIDDKCIQIKSHESADAALLDTHAAHARASGSGETYESLRIRLNKLEERLSRRVGKEEKLNIERECFEIRQQLALDDLLGRDPTFLEEDWEDV